MTPSPASPPQEMKTNNLALAFQEVFTVILRTRFFVQRVENADSFRATLRKMISAAVKDASALGYSDEASKMAIYAMIGFLDESILNSKDPTFADWARRPLQEEMFGGHFAGEYFFRNLTDLLNRPFMRFACCWATAAASPLETPQRFTRFCNASVTRSHAFAVRMRSSARRRLRLRRPKQSATHG